MTENKSTKLTALLLALVLVTACFVGGTLARYVTSTSSEDSARVAVWGINADTVTMDLFDGSYTVNGVLVAESEDGDNIIAPGTSKDNYFSIVNLDDNLKPEVMYEVAINLDDSEIDQSILNNPSIEWRLDEGAWGTWEDTKAAILMLSGDASGVKTYAPLEIANEFTSDKTHTVGWRWIMDNNNNVMDTEMGNEAVAGDIKAKISVKVTARQVQEDTTGLLNGDNQTFNMLMPSALSFRSAAPVDELQSVKVGDTTLTQGTDYTVSSGSTVITLSKNYLKTLEAGSYKLSIVSENRTVSTTFTVTEGLKQDEAGNYLIGTSDDLFMFAKLVNNSIWGRNGYKNVILTADIDLQNKPFTPIGYTKSVGAEGSSSTIGNFFYGTFDAQGHTIKNLNITATDEETNDNSAAGLFAAIVGSTNKTIIKNLKIDGANITSTHFAGVIAGTSENTAQIINCEVKNATVTSTYYNAENSGDKAGVIIGVLNANSSVSNCTVKDSTVVASRDAGQIVGAAKVTAVTDCTVTNVTVSHNGLGTGKNIRNELIGRILN